MTNLTKQKMGIILVKIHKEKLINLVQVAELEFSCAAIAKMKTAFPRRKKVLTCQKILHSIGALNG